MDTFQDRLKQIRGKLTQDEVSSRLDIHSITYGRYERGERSPDTEFVEKICRAFNVSANWLIMGQGPMRLDEGMVTAVPIDAAVQLLQEAEALAGIALNQSQRLAVLKILRKNLAEDRRDVIELIQSIQGGVKSEE